MAVTGVFTADFSNFDNAVQKSTTQLKLLEGGAGSVEKTFTKLGGEVPKDLKKITDETEKTEGATTGWTKALTNVVAGYLSIQGLQKVWGFAKDIMAEASALEDLSRQTRISTTDLQNLGNAMQGFGVDMEETGRALFGLSKRIGKGDDSVNDALLQMGLSIEKVKGLNPTELFLTIADAGGQMQDQFKDTTFVTLFGEKLGMSMSGAAKEIRAAYDEQVKFNNEVGPEANKALADADRAMEVFYTKWRNAAAINVFAPIAKGLTEYLEVSDKAGVAQTTWARIIDSLSPKAWHLKTQFEKLKEETAALVPVTEASTRATEATGRAAAGASPAIGNMAGETERLRKEEEKRLAAAKGLADFEATTKTAASDQVAIDARVKSEREAEIARTETLAKKLQAGEGFMKQLTETARLAKEAADFEKNLAEEQKKLDEENKALIKSWKGVGDAAKDAGTKGAEGGKETEQAWASVGQTVQFATDSASEFLKVMQYTAASNALLSQNSLWTSGSTYENQARLGGAFSPIPGFASGIENFGGGLARVHGGEVLANLPRGTSVIPKGGLGANISNVFNLVDSESNLARRVADLIMRQVRAGTQLGQA